MLDGYRHEALALDGHAGFVDSCVAVLHEGLESDDRMIVLAGSDKLGAVSDVLGPDAAEITLVPTDEHGRNPSRITSMLHSFQAGCGGRRCLGVNEVVFAGRSAAARAETTFSESLLNAAAVRSWPMSVVCVYDVSSADTSAVGAMRQNHEFLRGQRANADYLPDLAAATFAAGLEDGPDSASRLAVHAPELSSMRVFVRGGAARLGLDPDRTDDLVLAANEIVTNSLRYGAGRAHVAVWVADGAVVCEIRDHGTLTDMFAGRLAPPPTAASGRGLWLANLLCDLVQIRSSVSGTTVRLHVERRVTARL